MKKGSSAALAPLDFGPFAGFGILALPYFGFCGVENAIEIAFRTIDENPISVFFCSRNDSQPL
jgi:hypothetical protein